LRTEVVSFFASDRGPEQASVIKTLMWRLVDKTARIRFIVLSSEYATSGWRRVDILAVTALSKDGGLDLSSIACMSLC
jgi:hypothetical protein